MIAKERRCPDHGATSTDLVAQNAKKEPVYRCAEGRRPMGAHYFTIVAMNPEAATVKRKKK